MKLAELKSHLAARPELTLRFRLPDGSRVPAHAHVTEVARIEKRFIDCGGTLRTECHCRLQTWVALDLFHRLTAGQLLGILDKARPVLESENLEVDIEHEDGVLHAVSQYPLEAVEESEDELVLRLTGRHTACLAMNRWSPGAILRKLISKVFPCCR